jgi:hypothetical protein
VPDGQVDLGPRHQLEPRRAGLVPPPGAPAGLPGLPPRLHATARAAVSRCRRRRWVVPVTIIPARCPIVFRIRCGLVSGGSVVGVVVSGIVVWRSSGGGGGEGGGEGEGQVKGEVAAPDRVETYPSRRERLLQEHTTRRERSPTRRWKLTAAAAR